MAIREAIASVCDGLALTVSIFKSQGRNNPRGPLLLKERQFTIRLKSLSRLFAALSPVVLTFTDTQPARYTAISAAYTHPWQIIAGAALYPPPSALTNYQLLITYY
jgi:hypothetical protein